jgi:hypothetical protein
VGAVLLGLQGSFYVGEMCSFGGTGYFRYLFGFLDKTK